MYYHSILIVNKHLHICINSTYPDEHSRCESAIQHLTSCKRDNNVTLNMMNMTASVVVVSRTALVIYDIKHSIYN